MSGELSRVLLNALLLLGFFTGAEAAPSNNTSDAYIRQVDEASALWSFYRQKYIVNGRVISLDEHGITTSEGQGYAMLRAVWSNDRKTFADVWNWTKQNLQVRSDRLFAWKWKGKVLSINSATDADTDIALALILASRRFDNPSLEAEARAILESIWQQEILQAGSRWYATAGNWAVYEEYPIIHVAYLAPYAYEVFATVDAGHPWNLLVESSYAILHWIYDDQQLPVPPEVLYLDKRTGTLHLAHPLTGEAAQFGYDAFPLFWRVALDARWSGRAESPLRQQMLSFFLREWRTRHAFFDRYSLDGQPRSTLEGLPLYATVHALALQESDDLARLLSETKLAVLHPRALAGKATPYYLHNWLWFDRAFELQLVRTYDEFLGFLRPFDFTGFSAHFPWELFVVTIGLYALAQIHPVLKFAFLVCGFTLCARYLIWRFTHTLNFLETGGPFISLTLWAAELYAFSTVLLLFLQVGLQSHRTPRQLPSASPGFVPSADVFIPIYSESCDILEKTLIGACAMDYPNKRLYVLDDSHRDEVSQLAGRYDATYLKGPRQHAKAGNLNQALTQTAGELIVVFDTDHIPVRSFLTETVPFFADPAIGFVQTPHHFYNQDIFQRAFGAGHRIPNEQDMFNHAIQGGRDHWNGTFFVGSGAVFRRSAISQVNGFNLMSITEDIHTSQHLHGKGWRSAFVDKDLAVGLTAENFASYVVQRRRWMLGCLQIFFKDNPLFCRGLTWRQRLGYFASLYYFFFPIARVVFWITPLYYLLFHLHPIFSDVSVLVAYLLPFVIVLPMISSALLPGWSRMLWSSVYEAAVSFPLFRSMFDLLLPKRLGFKVTPKGLISNHRSFDWRSSMGLLLATAITVVAITKGVTEFVYFDIEKDAYFFNLSWAMVNLVFLLAGLLIAWEKPQRRREDRIRKSVPFTLQGDGVTLRGRTMDLSLSGVSFLRDTDDALPAVTELTLADYVPVTCRCRLVYHERLSGRTSRVGLAFMDLNPDCRETMILNLFANPETWEGVHMSRVRSNVVMALHLLRGVVHCLRPAKRRTRRIIRRKALRILRVEVDGHRHVVLLRDHSARGLGVVCVGRRFPATAPWKILEGRSRGTRLRPVYRRPIVPFLWRIGLQVEGQERAAHAEKAASAVPVEYSSQ